MVIKSFRESLFEEEIDKKLEKERKDIEELVLIKTNELLKENENLRNELTELKNFVDKKGKKRITANKQLLILLYLNFFDNLNLSTREKKYKLLHLIIDKTPHTVKEFFINMEKSDSKEYREIFSEKNLYFVLDLFKELDLKEEVGRVDSQMIKLKM